MRGPKKWTHKSLNERYETRRQLGRYKYDMDVKAEAIIGKALKAGEGVPFDTPFGPVTVTAQQKKGGVYQLMVSTKKTDYLKSPYAKKQQWAKYRQWARVLDKQAKSEKQQKKTEIVDDLLGAMTQKDYKIQGTYSDEVRRAASSLLAAIYVSEEYRIDGMRKLGRATIRALKSKYSFTEAFTGDSPIFTPALEDGGTSLTRSLALEKETPTQKQKKVLEDLSDSDEDL